LCANEMNKKKKTGYPTAAGAAEQGGKKSRRGSTKSRGDKGFIEGW
ncbi:Os01g0948600, partial [Oryza sativa Japonica Group]